MGQSQSGCGKSSDTIKAAEKPVEEVKKPIPPTALSVVSSGECCRKANEQSNLLRFKMEVLINMLAIEEKKVLTLEKRLDALKWVLLSGGVSQDALRDLLKGPVENIERDKNIFTLERKGYDALDIAGPIARARQDFETFKVDIFQCFADSEGRISSSMAREDFMRQLYSVTEYMTKDDVQLLSWRFSDGSSVSVPEFLHFFTAPATSRQARAAADAVRMSLNLLSIDADAKNVDVSTGSAQKTIYYETKTLDGAVTKLSHLWDRVGDTLSDTFEQLKARSYGTQVIEIKHFQEILTHVCGETLNVPAESSQTILCHADIEIITERFEIGGHVHFGHFLQFFREAHTKIRVPGERGRSVSLRASPIYSSSEWKSLKSVINLDGGKNNDENIAVKSNIGSVASSSIKSSAKPPKPPRISLATPKDGNDSDFNEDGTPKPIKTVSRKTPGVEAGLSVSAPGLQFVPKGAVTFTPVASASSTTSATPAAAIRDGDVAAESSPLQIEAQHILHADSQAMEAYIDKRGTAAASSTKVATTPADVEAWARSQLASKNPAPSSIARDDNNSDDDRNHHSKESDDLRRLMQPTPAKANNILISPIVVAADTPVVRQTEASNAVLDKSDSNRQSASSLASIRDEASHTPSSHRPDMPAAAVTSSPHSTAPFVPKVVEGPGGRDPLFSFLGKLKSGLSTSSSSASVISSTADVAVDKSSKGTFGRLFSMKRDESSGAKAASKMIPQKVQVTKQDPLDTVNRNARFG